MTENTTKQCILDSSKLDNDVVKPKGWGYRHQQCFILFCCLTTAYSMRSCMGVALVAMTDYHSSIVTDNNGSSIDQLHNDGFNSSNISYYSKNLTTNDNYLDENKTVESEYSYPTFPWSKKIQDMIISSFFWGYMTLQIPSGQLAHRFGAKYLICATMAINSIVSICLPWAAIYGGWTFVVVLRLIQGLSQACLFPSTHTFFGKWAPLQERGRLTALVYGGQALGTVLGLPITGFIASSGLGWPGIFRFYGTLSALMGCIWLYFGSDSPSLHPSISVEERTYIERELGKANSSKDTKLKVPWRNILTSKGVWAIVIAHIGHTWGQLILYLEVPAYMDKVMGVNIKANGLLTALPFLIMWFSNFGFSWLTDYIINKQFLSVTNTRKLANTIGCWPPAVLLVVLAYAPKNIYIIETLLVTICALKIAGHLGFQINHIDIAPNFAGTMMSISNFASNGFASFAPIVTGFILTDVTDERLWRKVFCLAAGLYLFTNLFYILVGTAETAEWNEPNRRNKSHNDAELEKESIEVMLK